MGSGYSSVPQDGRLATNVEQGLKDRRLRSVPLKNVLVPFLVALNVILSLLLLHKSKREFIPPTYGQ